MIFKIDVLMMFNTLTCEQVEDQLKVPGLNWLYQLLQKFPLLYRLYRYHNFQSYQSELPLVELSPCAPEVYSFSFCLQKLILRMYYDRPATLLVALALRTPLSLETPNLPSK